MILRSAMRDVLKKFLALVSIAFLVVLPLSSVQAVNGDGLIAYPTTTDPNNSLSESWFIYNLPGGDSKEDSLTIKNESDQEQAVSIYAVDSTTNNMGEFALEGETDTRDNIGKWITIETDHLILKAKEEKRVKFKIDIPSDTPAGEISGGIIIQKDLTEAQKNTKSGFIINTRIGVRVYETVPGETLRSASFGSSYIQYNEKDKVYVYTVTVKNDSNISLGSTVRIKAKDTLFDKQSQALEQTINIPRGEEAKVVFNLDKAKIGKFEVSSELEYKKTDGSKEIIVNQDKISFYAFPNEFIPIIGLLLLVNIFFILILKVKKRRNKKYIKEYQIQMGDNLENLADRLEISWKKIAKMNKLKPPYQLEKGQTITLIDKKDVLSNIFPKSEVLTEPTERVRQGRKEAFEKDLALISDDKNSASSIDNKSKGKSVFKYLILAVILSVIGYYIYIGVIIRDNNANFVYNQNDEKTEGSQADDKAQDTEQVVQTEEQPSSEISTTSADTITSEEITATDRQGIKIDVLNGSGIKGVSSKVSVLFKTQGYTLLTVGNADRFDYIKTIIKCGSKVKPAVCAEAEKIVSEAYPSWETQQDSNILNADKITIILGK